MCVVSLLDCRTTFTHQRTCVDPILPTGSHVLSFWKK